MHRPPHYDRVLITGSRTWEDTTVLRDALAAVWHPWTVLVHGACWQGADAMADECWRQWGGRVERHPAKWREHGRAAGFQRNYHMISRGADLCLAFIRDRSPGASHCACWAQMAGIPTHVFADHAPRATTSARGRR